MMLRRVISNHPCNYQFPGKVTDSIVKCITDLQNNVPVIPCTIWGKEVKGNKKHQISPVTDDTCAIYHNTTSEMMHDVLSDSKKNRIVPVTDPAGILRRAANLAVTKYNDQLLATTMLGQGKTQMQAEIDAIAELADFWNFNAKYIEDIFRTQPSVTHTQTSNEQHFNSSHYYGLRGLTTVITPFNFTAIAGNLVSLPAVMGSNVVWKPSPRSVLSNWVVYQILVEAGLPKEKISFVPSEIDDFQPVLKNPDLSLVAFTGSSKAFQKICQTVYSVKDRNNFPRLLGETGGKNFIFMDEYANLQRVAEGVFRAGFEYSGQKCSACSIAFIPRNRLNDFQLEMEKLANEYPMVGNVFGKESPVTGPVIDVEAVAKFNKYLDIAQNDASTTSITQYGCVDDLGSCYVKPTMVVNEDLSSPLFQEEIFAPFVTVYPYDEQQIGTLKELETYLDMVSKVNPYSLTASFYSNSENRINIAIDTLKYAAGNLYINTQCTGSVVGNQPFGGSGLSGTNDKPGGSSFPLRFMEEVTLKRTKYLD